MVLGVGAVSWLRFETGGGAGRALSMLVPVCALELPMKGAVEKNLACFCYLGSMLV